MKLKKSDKVMLRFLSVCKNEQQKAVLSNLTLGQFRLIISVIYNTLHAVVPLSDRDKSKLGKHKLFIRRVLSKDITRSKRRNYLLKISKQLPVFLRAFIQSWQKN